MNVNLNVYNNYLKTQEYGTHNKESEPGTAVKPSGTKQDQVCISADAAAYSARDKQVKAIASEVNAIGSPERLHALHDQIQSGTYQVSPERVADAMLSRFAV